jgi:GT2 family glycosyltransferase
MAEKILIIIMNYFNEDEVCSFIRSQVLPCKTEEMEVMVVINAMANPSLLNELTRESGDIIIVDAGKNLGYLPGARFGLNTYLSRRKQMPEAVIISNTDVTFPDPEMLRKLSGKISVKGFDILGPDVRSSFDGEHINPYIPQRISERKMRTIAFFSRNFLAFSGLLLISYLRHWAGYKMKISGQVPSEPHETYGIHGSFMVFAKSYFEKGGTLDYPFPLFGEEIFISETGRTLNLNTFFDPGLKVIHHGHSTTGFIKKPRTVKGLHEAYLYLIKTFYS